MRVLVIAFMLSWPLCASSAEYASYRACFDSIRYTVNGVGKSQIEISENTEYSRIPINGDVFGILCQRPPEEISFKGTVEDTSELKLSNNMIIKIKYKSVAEILSELRKALLMLYSPRMPSYLINKQRNKMIENPK